MLEHEQNMIALNDHLQMTRLRQQKRFVYPFLSMNNDVFVTDYVPVLTAITPGTAVTASHSILPTKSSIRIGLLFSCYLNFPVTWRFFPLMCSNFYRHRLEQRLATRRARLAELRQQMEKEREEQSQNDPEALKTLTRVQVRILYHSNFICPVS